LYQQRGVPLPTSALVIIQQLHFNGQSATTEPNAAKTDIRELLVWLQLFVVAVATNLNMLPTLQMQG
jgi:hypothetical protein